MKLSNRSDYTINFTRKALNRIRQKADLTKPNEVRMFIALLKTSDGYKRNLCISYNRYAKHHNFTWDMPKYREEAKNIALPTREKIQMLIASAGKLLGLKLQLSMETGLRPVELARLKVKDLDLEHKTVNPTTAKKGNARTVPISDVMKLKLTEHITTRSLAPTDLLFKGTDSDHYGKQYRNLRNALADKLKDPSLKTIRLYDLRHYFCKETTRHRESIYRNDANGSHEANDYTEVHALAEPQRRRMDLHRSNNSQRSNQTHRSRLSIRHNNRRNTTIQKTQITPLFLLSTIVLLICFAPSLFRALEEEVQRL